MGCGESDFVLLHQLLHFGRAADDLSGFSNHCAKHGCKVRIGLAWLSLHCSQDAVEQGRRCTSTSRVPQEEGALHGAGTGVHVQQAAESLLCSGPLRSIV